VNTSVNVTVNISDDDTVTINDGDVTNTSSSKSKQDQEQSQTSKGGSGSNGTSGGEKLTICHKGKTIEVAQAAVQAHLDHGDTLGACPEIVVAKRKPTVKAKKK